MKKHRFIKIADIILIAAVLLCSFFFMIIKNTDEPSLLIIYLDGQEYKRIDLEKNTVDQLIEVENVKVYVSHNGTVQVNESDCPDKLCMNGAIKKAGSTIACVPNKVVVTIVKNDNYVDGVTG